MTSPIDGGEGPKPGDVCICMTCAAIQLVGENLELLELPKDKLEELKLDKDVWKVICAGIEAVKQVRFAYIFGGKPWKDYQNQA